MNQPLHLQGSTVNKTVVCYSKSAISKEEVPDMSIQRTNGHGELLEDIHCLSGWHGSDDDLMYW